jgi:hypothetical protein
MPLTLPVTYRNGNTTVTLHADGTKTREWPDGEEPRPEFPESVDLKVTDYCDLGCKYCHEDSTTEGRHGPVGVIYRMLRDAPPGTEVAIGGGDPLSHPEIDLILRGINSLGLVANITVNGRHLRRHFDLLRQFKREGLIHGIGVSSPPQRGGVEDLINRLGSNVVIHLIAGVDKLDRFDRHSIGWFNLPGEPRKKFLILGYKTYGRGVQFKSEAVEDSLRRCSPPRPGPAATWATTAPSACTWTPSPTRSPRPAARPACPVRGGACPRCSPSFETRCQPDDRRSSHVRAPRHGRRPARLAGSGGLPDRLHRPQRPLVALRGVRPQPQGIRAAVSVTVPAFVAGLSNDQAQQLIDALDNGLTAAHVRKLRTRVGNAPLRPEDTLNRMILGTRARNTIAIALESLHTPEELAAMSKPLWKELFRIHTVADLCSFRASELLAVKYQCGISTLQEIELALLDCGLTLGRRPE